METTPEPATQAQFAFWGPQGAGKDWMIRAFARALEQYNKRDSKLWDEHFNHELLSEDGSPVSTAAPSQPIPPNQTGEIEPQEELFFYKRVPRDPYRNSKSHRLSTHSHTIITTNDAGEDLEKMTKHGTNVRFDTAQCVLILLDPTAIREGRKLPSDYLEGVDRLLKKLRPLSTGKRYFAACLTKIDVLKLAAEHTHPMENINVLFGKQMVELLHAHNSKSVEVRAFSVSSFGFLRGTRSKESNADEAGLLLRDPDNWAPVNVEQPFFWLFQSLEKSRLNKFSTSLSRMLFSEERQKSYRNYPLR